MVMIGVVAHEPNEMQENPFCHLIGTLNAVFWNNNPHPHHNHIVVACLPTSEDLSMDSLDPLLSIP